MLHHTALSICIHSHLFSKPPFMLWIIFYCYIVTSYTVKTIDRQLIVSHLHLIHRSKNSLLSFAIAIYFCECHAQGCSLGLLPYLQIKCSYIMCSICHIRMRHDSCVHAWMMHICIVFSEYILLSMQPKLSIIIITNCYTFMPANI